MRIVSFPASIAVLLLAALLFLANFTQFCGSASSSQMDSSNSKEFNSNQEESKEDDKNSPWYETGTLRPWMAAGKAEEFLVDQGGQNKTPVECCPSTKVYSEPVGGVTRDDIYVKLYKGEIPQYFHEISCNPEILHQPCLFMERRMHNRSRCVQNYSYSYAVVLLPESSVSGFPEHKFSPIFSNETNRYILTHIKIRSGCSCEVRSDRPQKYKKKKKT